jgi:Integrase core domain
MESFNRTFRAECLDVHSFMTLAEEQVVESWTQEYNKSSSPVPRGEDAGEFADEIAISGDQTGSQAVENSTLTLGQKKGAMKSIENLHWEWYSTPLSTKECSDAGRQDNRNDSRYLQFDGKHRKQRQGRS